ncbi:hypothetical protein ACHQM5_029360 [Ranunculus cassubicifolius]
MEIIAGEQVGDRDDHLVNSIKSMLQTVPPLPSEPCIYRVPYVHRRVNEEAYTPVIVSIGPLHHGKQTLQEMEVHKQRYLNDFLKRRPDIGLKNYVRILRDIEERARNCYAECIMLGSDDFIQIMLLDGCFIIELFLKCMYTQFRNKNDPIFMASVIRFEVRRDMLLLENQLPFFVLECLFDLNVEAGLHMGLSFDKIALHFIGSFVGSLQLRRSSYQVKHFVDLYIQCHALPEARMLPRGGTAIRSIPSATKLHDAGVEFKKSMTSKHFMDVKFSNQGFLEMPSFVVGDTAESFLRNLIAFEQCDNSNTRYISEYIVLLSNG